MSHAGFQAEPFEKRLKASAPVCHWAFNQSRRFEYISGNSAALFRRELSELVNQHISTIDDAPGSWAARLERVFTGSTLVEPYARWASNEHYSLIHLPLRAENASVLYAAGFAFAADQKTSAVPALELAALLSIEALKTDRARVARFLHDIVAQSLSGTGLQVELLRMEIERRGLELSGPIEDLQRFLDEALTRVRRFTEEEGSKTA
jgi:signal transduction histidine kinase